MTHTAPESRQSGFKFPAFADGVSTASGLQPTSCATAEETVSCFRQIEGELIERGDVHAYFTNVYITISERCLEVARAGEQAEHPEHDRFRNIDSGLLRRLVLHFGEAYIAAISGYARRTPSDMPVPWHSVFDDASCSGRKSFAILLGATTHIGLDLPFVLAGSDGRGEPLYRIDDILARQTFDRLNAVIADLLPAIFQSLGKLEQTWRRKYGAGYPVFAFLFLYRIGGSALWRPVVRMLIGLAREEAEWLSIGIGRGVVTRSEVEVRMNYRVRILCGPWALPRLGWFLIHGLVARRRHRPRHRIR